MFRKKSVFTCILSLGVLVFSAQAQAQTIKDQFSVPMPEIEMTPIADFVAKSNEIELDSSRSPELGFYIRIPKDWTDSTKAGIETDIGQKVLSELKNFYGPPNLYSPRSHVLVEAVELDHDFLNRLPENVDPCGENGEFHTFCYAGPIFKKPLNIELGEKTYRSYDNPEDKSKSIQFGWCDLILK